ncbi:MAG: CHAT domain-containing protein, partial [Pseudomonadota bacterium]
ADSLQVLVDARLAQSDAPLHLMAHSMGGLVSSLYMNKHPASWARLRERGGRLVQAGTPNGGSYSIPRIFSGDEQVLKMIALLDLRNDIKDWLKWISRFPGLLQMAPLSNGPDFSRVQTWRDLGARVPPTSADLRRAEATRQKLKAQSDRLASEGVLYVAGGPEDTPVFDDNSGDIRFTQRGDGRVTWASIPDGLPTWYLPVKHGDLLDTRKAFGALRELLFDGRTTKLTQTPPFASDLLRGETLEQPLLAAPDDWEVFPSQEALEGAALGMSMERTSDDLTTEDMVPCRVSVVHGDLRFTDRPMIVGHYRGDPIVHAERVLCDCLDGALSARHQLGVYPGPSGTADVVLGKKFGAERSHGPTGAIVVGLGNVGELSPGSLNRSVEVGLLRFAQAVTERGGVASDLKISALLVGTNEVGVTTSQALDAILSAVVSVNRALQNMATDDDADSRISGVRIADLEFVELYEDIALDALHSLGEFEKKKGLQIERTLQRRGGRQWRSRTRFEMGWWTRVQIRDVSQQSGDSSAALSQRLQFTAYGDRARAPISEIGVQKPLVDQLVHDAIVAGSRGETKLPQTLFELLVPSDFKPNASDRRNVQLVLDPASAVYPWELLVDRYQSDDAPVGLGAGLLRQLRVETPPAVSHSEDTRILVVGDPPSGRVALPGAVAEASAVAEMFDDRFGWDVIRCINDGRTSVSATDITSALVTNDLRILHLAGHGEYDKDEPTRSGMVIGGGNGAPEIFISAEEVKRMRPLPELVFINCCHIGKIEETPPLGKLAASLAQAFIEAGAKAVVAAGWPIEDQAAKRFALEFYTCMLNGDDFGAAVTRARQEAYKAGTNTWGAYQCYGDSGFRLLIDQGVRRRARGGSSDDDPYWDISEARIALRNLVSRARVATTDGDQAAVAGTTEWLWRRCEQRDWFGEPGILVGFARAYGEQRNFEQAVALYEQAMQLSESGITINDLEQLANFRVRKAVDASELSRATRDLERLIRTYGATGERVSLLASAYKRLAQRQSTDKQTTVAELRDTWLKMALTYADAMSHGDENWFYPAGNALLGVVVLGGPWSSAPRARASREVWETLSIAKDEAFHSLLAESKQAMQQLPVADFWDAVGPVDLEVTEHLEAGSLPAEVANLGGRYREIAARYGSGRELDSVTSHWRIAERVLRRFRSVKQANAVKDLLGAIEQ